MQRRRDRINEKMRALQELIPNCNRVELYFLVLTSQLEYKADFYFYTRFLGYHDFCDCMCIRWIKLRCWMRR